MDSDVMKAIGALAPAEKSAVLSMLLPPIGSGYAASGPAIELRLRRDAIRKGTLPQE